MDDKQYNEASADRLLKICNKKIETTMIGALASIEEIFGFLWLHGDNEKDEQHEIYLSMYNELRSKILDVGNTQKRNLAVEMNQYDVHWRRYQMTLPVKNRVNPIN